MRATVLSRQVLGAAGDVLHQAHRASRRACRSQPTILHVRNATLASLSSSKTLGVPAVRPTQTSCTDESEVELNQVAASQNGCARHAAAHSSKFAAGRRWRRQSAAETAVRRSVAL